MLAMQKGLKKHYRRNFSMRLQNRALSLLIDYLMRHSRTLRLPEVH